MPGEAPAMSPIGTLSQRLRTLSQAREIENGTIDQAVVNAIAAAGPDGPTMFSPPRPDTKALIASCTHRNQRKGQAEASGEQWAAFLVSRGGPGRAKEIADPPQQWLDKKSEDQAEQQSRQQIGARQMARGDAQALPDDLRRRCADRHPKCRDQRHRAGDYPIGAHVRYTLARGGPTRAPTFAGRRQNCHDHMKCPRLGGG